MQELIVGAAVACAACFVVLHYVPKPLLRASGNAVVRGARRAGWSGLAAHLEKALAEASGVGQCGSCGGCKGEGGKPSSGISVEDLRRTARTPGK